MRSLSFTYVVFEGKGSGRSTRESNRHVQQVFRTMFGMPEMFSIIALRDVGLLTSRDARGPLFDRHLWDSVMCKLCKKQ